MKNKRTILVSIFVVGLLGLVGTMEYKRQMISAQLQELEQDFEETQGQDINQEQLNNVELAAKIIAEVRALIEIPEDVEPTVATIVDVNILRERNPFYEVAENGDHLLVTPTRAILYSSKQKKILDVAPVQLEEQPQQGGGSVEE